MKLLSKTNSIFNLYTKSKLITDGTRIGSGNSFVLFESLTKRHLEGRKRAPRFQGPIHARFWREWADQRASSPERPFVYLTKTQGPSPQFGR